jgi:hypothetical protein
MKEPVVDRTPIKAHTPKAKPDARPMRLALGAGGLAALSALAATIVTPPQPSVPVTVDVPQATSAAQGTSVNVQQAVQYIQLLPGQTAPPGAKVIDAAAPTPMTVVVTITPAPAAPQKAPKRIIIKTTQSGKVIP